MTKKTNTGSRTKGRRVIVRSQKPSKTTTAHVKTSSKQTEIDETLFEDSPVDEEDEIVISDTSERAVKFGGLIRSLQRHHGRNAQQKAEWLKSLDPRTHDTTVEFTSYAEYGDGSCACGHPIKYAAVITDNDTGESIQLGMDCFSYVSYYWDSWSVAEIKEMDKLMKSNKRFAVEIDGQPYTKKELTAIYDKLRRIERKKRDDHIRAVKEGKKKWSSLEHIRTKELQFAGLMKNKAFLEFVTIQGRTELFTSFLNQLIHRNLSQRQMYFINESIQDFISNKRLANASEAEKSEHLKKKLGDQFSTLQQLSKNPELRKILRTRSSLAKEDSYDSSMTIFDKFYKMLEAGKPLSAPQLNWLKGCMVEEEMKRTGKVIYPDTELGRMLEHCVEHIDRIEKEQSRGSFNPKNYIESFKTAINRPKGLSGPQRDVLRKVYNRDVRKHPESLEEELDVITISEDDEWA